MEIIIIIIWIFLCFLVALSGTNKRIGYWGVFLFSIILSPLIGLIIGLVSAPKEVRQVPKVDNSESLKKEVRYLISNKEFEIAIKLLKRALTIDPTNIDTMYNLACCYSLQNRNTDALSILSSAIENGYSNFWLINTDKDLANLRDTSEFRTFKNNNYKFAPNNPPIESNLDKIKKLKELKDEGAITEEEFETEKKKLLI